MPSKIRDRIIKAAADCFANKGFAGTSTKEIAKRARVNETSIFRLFKSKRRLFETVFAVVTGACADRLDILADEPDFRKAIQNFAVAYSAGLTRQVLRLEFVAFLEFPELMREGARPWMIRYLAIMEKRIRSEQQAGRGVRRIHAESAALALNNILYHYGVQVHLYRYPKRLPFAPTKEALRRLVHSWCCSVLASK